MCYVSSVVTVRDSAMPATLKERVEILERRIDELSADPARAKDWRRTFGMSADDPGFDEMIELGRKARVAANRQKRPGTRVRT